MKLSDEVIGHIAKLVQLAILTGTDVVDHIRMLNLEEDASGTLSMTKDYEKQSEENIAKMLNKVATLVNE